MVVGYDYSYFVFVVVSNIVFIFDWIIGLDNCFDFFVICNFYIIGEWEESIGGYYCFVEVKIESFCFGDGLFKGIYLWRLVIVYVN